MNVCIHTLREDTLPIVEAFAEGCDGKILKPNEFRRARGVESVAVYGILRGSGDCFRWAQDNKITAFHIDHAHINGCRAKRQYDIQEDHWFRISKNATNNLDFRPRPDDRLKKLESHFALKEWRDIKGPFLLAPPDDKIIDFYRQRTWLGETISALEQAGFGNDIYIRQRRSQVPLLQDLHRCRAVITYISNIAVDAMIEGIPAYVDKVSALSKWCPDAKKKGALLKPWKGDREEVLRHISYSQFQVSEMRDGSAWRLLNE